MEFEVEWDEKERAKWGGVDPDEIDVERYIFFTLLSNREFDRNSMRIIGAEAYKDSFYRTNITPEKYKCSKCSSSNIKLWRQYQTFADNIELLCGSCALKDQNKTGPIDDNGRIKGEYGFTDQIGWLVPAVPTEDGDTFWGYTSVPSSGCRWWRNLPTNGK